MALLVYLKQIICIQRIIISYFELSPKKDIYIKVDFKDGILDTFYMLVPYYGIFCVVYAGLYTAQGRVTKLCIQKRNICTLHFSL